jgi:hypothetical protein
MGKGRETVPLPTDRSCLEPREVMLHSLNIRHYQYGNASGQKFIKFMANASPIVYPCSHSRKTIDLPMASVLLRLLCVEEKTMATPVNYTLPIYEAVVCNLTLEKMRLDESEQEQEALLAKVLECVSRSKEVLRIFSEFDFSAISAEGLSQAHVGLCVLVSIGRPTMAHFRQTLPAICDKYRDFLASSLDDFSANVERIEELCEAWGMAYDENLVTEIKQAISDSNTEKDIPDWRSALAAFSD